MAHHQTREELEREIQDLRKERAWLRAAQPIQTQTPEGRGTMELPLAEMIHSLMDGLIIINEKQHILLFNAAAARLFQRSEQDTLGKPIEELIPERFRDAHKQHIEDFALHSTTSRRMGDLGTVIGLRSNGEEFPVEAAISKIETDGKKWLTVILRDVTERMRMEQQLKDSEEQFQTFMNHCPALAWMKDQEGRYVYVNKTFEEILQLPLAACAGKTDNDIWPQSVARQLQEHDLAVLSQGKPIELHEQVPTPDNELKDWLVFKFPLIKQNTNRYVGGFAVDMTQRNQLEKQLRQTERVAELGSLTSGLAHEIGTPMNVILGRAELLLRKAPDETTQKGLQIIVSQVERVTKLINQLLSFARKRPGERRPIDLPVVIKDVLDVVQERQKKQHIQVETHWDLHTPKIIADPDQMHQVLLNLVMNAFQAMPKGGRLSIELQGRTSNIELTISDTGCGISKENLPKLFEPFYTTKEVGEGTGLGLSVVQGIIKEHHGSIAVDSQPGQGTTFRLLIPINQ